MVDVASLIERRRQILLDAPHLETISGSIASFKTDVLAPLKSCKINFVPIQEGSGDPSPENVRPITGWTEAALYKTGKNWFDESILTEQTAWKTVKLPQLKKGVYYVFRTDMPNFTSSGDNSLLLYFLNDGNVQSSSNKVHADHSVFLTPDDKGAVVIFRRPKGSNKFSNYHFWINVYDGTVQKYEPYQGTTIPVSWQSEAGTVYGGYVDLAKGEVVEEWSQIASYNGETLTGKWISDRDVYTAGTSPTIGAQAVYELTAPIAHQLTPETIKTLKGVNNIWSNTNGNIEVKFWKH